jgi:hypothetical protein
MTPRWWIGRTASRNNKHRIGRTSPRPQLEALEERCLLSGDVVLEWNAIALDALKNDSYLGANARQAGPDRASRALAIVSAAVFDAVNSIDRSYTPYLIQVSAPPGASVTAAAATAAHDTLAALFPDYQPVLDARLAADLKGAPHGRPWVDGAAVGHAVAQFILDARSHDGSDAPMSYTPGDQPGQWQPDPLHPDQTAHGPLWGDVTPFAIPSAQQFEVPPPPALTSQEYTDAFNEVKELGSATSTVRTAEQTQIGIFWGYDGSPGLSTPPRLYDQIAEVIAAQQHNTLAENARFFALINLAMADAGISCWDGKYDYNFWRPDTANRAADTDGNPDTAADPGWVPLGSPADNGSGTNFTPPFPAYASGHATFGGALFRMMADFYGTDDISFTIGSDEFNGITRDQDGVVRPVVTRSFSSFSQAAEENGQSRIYLGIHWSFDKVQGITCGDHIADYVFANLLKPVSHGDKGHDKGPDKPHDKGPGKGDGKEGGPADAPPPPKGAHGALPPARPEVWTDAVRALTPPAPPSGPAVVTPDLPSGGPQTGPSLLAGPADAGSHAMTLDSIFGSLGKGQAGKAHKDDLTPGGDVLPGQDLLGRP